MDPATTKGVSELMMTKATMAGKPPRDQSGSAIEDDRDGNLRNEHLGQDRQQEQQPSSSSNHPI
jgi:hypothetical protein